MMTSRHTAPPPDTTDAVDTLADSIPDLARRAVRTRFTGRAGRTMPVARGAAALAMAGAPSGTTPRGGIRFPTGTKMGAALARLAGGV